MNPEELTPEMILDAGRKLQKWKGWFTARDIWYDLGFGRFSRTRLKKGVRIIAGMLRELTYRGKIRIYSTSSCGRTKYVVAGGGENNGFT